MEISLLHSNYLLHLSPLSLSLLVFRIIQAIKLIVLILVPLQAAKSVADIITRLLHAIIDRT